MAWDMTWKGKKTINVNVNIIPHAFPLGGPVLLGPGESIRTGAGPVQTF